MLAINIWTWCTSSSYRHFLRKWYHHYTELRHYGYVKGSFTRFLQTQMNEDWTLAHWEEVCDGMVPSLEALLNAVHLPSATGSWWWHTLLEEIAVNHDLSLIECTTRYQYVLMKMHQKTAEFSSHKDCYKHITVLDMRIQNGRRTCTVVQVAPDFHRWWMWLEGAQKAWHAGTLTDFLVLQPHP